MPKITMLEKLCRVNLYSFIFFMGFIQALETAQPPKTYAFADSTVSMPLKKNLMKLEKIYRPFSDFKCNLQQFSLFSKVLVCTQNSKDIDEPQFLVLS